MLLTSLLYNLRVCLGLIQVGLIILLPFDGIYLDLFMTSLSRYRNEDESKIPKEFYDQFQYQLKMLRLVTSVMILLIANQSIKMLNLAFGLHKSHHRQIKISGILDLLNVVFFVALIVIYHLPNTIYSYNRKRQDILHACGIVLSIASCALTFVVVSKLRQLDSLPSPNTSLLYKLRIFLGLSQVPSIVILTLIANLSQGFKDFGSFLQEDIDKSTGHSEGYVESIKVVINLLHTGYLVCTALVAIQCFRKTILAVGLHKNNPFVISAAGLLEIIVISLFGWLFFLLKQLNQADQLQDPYLERTYGFGIAFAISGAIGCFILSFKLFKQSRNAVA